MGRYLKYVGITVVLIVGVLLAVGLTMNRAIATLAETSEKLGTIQVKGGEYIVQNNVWGATTAQTVTVPDTDQTGFIVSLSEHDQENVASYPSIFKGSHVGTCTSGWSSIRIQNLSSASYSWSVSTEGVSGKYNVATDIWFSPNLDTSGGYSGGGEMTIWLDSKGMVPAGSKVGDFGDYEVWYADWDWNYICYYLGQNTGESSVSINLMDFINDAVSRGYLDNTWYLHAIEAGFEICSGGQGLTVNSFLASVSSGFSVTVSPDNGIVVRGGSVSSTVTVAGTGEFAGTVGLSYYISPSTSDVTVVFTPPSGDAPFNSIMNIATAPAAVPGTYTITITGTSGTTAERTGNYKLTIYPPAPWVAFELENLYAVSINVDGYIGVGEKLVAKFYSYSGQYQDGIIVCSEGIPGYVTLLHENVSRPGGGAIEMLKLVVVDAVGAEVLVLGSYITNR